MQGEPVDIGDTHAGLFEATVYRKGYLAVDEVEHRTPLHVQPHIVLRLRDQLAGIVQQGTFRTACGNNDRIALFPVGAKIGCQDFAAAFASRDPGHRRRIAEDTVGILVMRFDDA